MAAQPKIRPPFVWLGKYAALGSVLSSLAISAIFRFLHLGSLPPGLDTASAAIGLQASGLADHGVLPGLNAINGYAPLFVWLQALSIKVLGHTELALRLWPAALGTLAILLTWAWARAWFGLRTAWLTSLLLAITPWAVTQSRSGVEAAMFPLLASLTLYAATIAWRQRSLWTGVALGAAFIVDLLSGPLGWLMVAATIAIALLLRAKGHEFFRMDRARIAAVLGLAAGLGALGYLFSSSMTAIKALPAAAGFATTGSSLAANIVKTLLMFNVRGDENFRHNMSGEPLLNAFVGLMFVAGILVSISRLHQRRYRLLFVLLIVLLLPALATTVGVPNAARAGLTLPLILALAAIGISYMLELWYRTFPINSAARSTGQAMILVLLGLSLFQGYTQYFRAWANSSDVYTAHNESANRMAHSILDDHKFTGTRYVVAQPAEQPVIAYLVHSSKPYAAISAHDIATLPITPGTRQFVISIASHDEAVQALKLKFPGGVIRPLISSFSLSDISYIYEVTK
jgi:4-amino-4-deoxy-L-arabinose transferase-like glycosyltransferase